MKEEFMIIEYFVNGVLIGLVFGMPIGAVGAMSIQRTINHGVVAGFISGAASSLADVLYACVGAFGLTVFSFDIPNANPSDWRIFDDLDSDKNDHKKRNDAIY